MYSYIGPHELRATGSERPHRFNIGKALDVRDWIAATGQRPDATGEFSATFIVDLDGRLWIADRQSEHVDCARGEPVLSAGEITFERVGDRISVIAVTNQSTGYCPEPESWDAVAVAFDRARLLRPASWTTAFLFRRCDRCGMLNIVKDGIFECAACGQALRADWNCG